MNCFFARTYSLLLNSFWFRPESLLTLRKIRKVFCFYYVEDTKKDSKKEEVVVEEGEKPVEFDFEKSVSEFLFVTDIPTDS